MGHFRCRVAASPAELTRCGNVVGMANQEYRVWGYIAGDPLPPDMVFNLGGGPWLRLTRDIPEVLHRCGPVSSLQIKPAARSTWIGGSSRLTVAGSELAFETAVDGEDEERAMRLVQNQVLPRYLATLSALAEVPIYGVVVAAHREAAPGETVGWMSDSPTGRIFDWSSPGPARMPVAMVQESPALLWAATNDATARRAAYDLHSANLNLYSRSNDTADLQSILLTYYFVLERISRQVGRLHPQPAPPADASQRAVVKLEKALERSDTVDRKVAAVRKAATTLQALHSRSMRKQVEDAGEVIRVDPGMVRLAGRLTDLRHRRLGHVSALGHESDELDAWLDDAQRCAVSYLSKYLRWVGKRGEAPST